MSSFCWAIVLQAAAAALLVGEAFLPSMGLLAAATIAAIIGSLYFAWGPGLQFWLLLGLDLIIFPLLAWKLLALAARHSPLALPQQLENGGASLSQDSLRGVTGTAATDFRPAGKIRVGEQLLDAESSGQFLTQGTALLICKVSQNRLFVRAARPDEITPASGDSSCHPS